ncbi:MAG TPA: phosphonopyruvate decarboxylase [Chryseolinea sp.]|nr:phosphonopyruvate decarboxylase [Chryseolinea sp.]
MINTKTFGDEMKALGFDFYSGVPCSFLKALINYAINECDYVMAANEGDAVAIASGAKLGGKKAVVLMQNSGLTNATSPLTSLNYTFKLPVLGFVSLRGEPGVKDEPQHELMGQITEKMLALMRVEWAYLSEDMTEAASQLKKANEHIEAGRTFFFVVKKGTLGDVKLNPQALKQVSNNKLKKSSAKQSLPIRTQALKSISDLADQDTILLATTGKTGRELFEVEDKPNNLYMVGSMGCISSLALGLALARQDKKIIAIDGDGAALMRLGSFATNAYYQPKNMMHIVLDNNAHDSTGGQATVSHIVDFAGVASTVSYPVALQVNSLQELEESIEQWKKNPELTFIHMKISQGSPAELGRPTVKPFEVKDRLIQFIG